jgi:hypothetical protein
MKVINKSITDNTQIIEKKGDEFIIISKYGAKIVFKYKFKEEELEKFNPTFNISYNVHEFVKNKINALNLKWFDETNPLHNRIIDAHMYGILKIIGKN